MAPAGFVQSNYWWILREARPEIETKLYFECFDGNGSFPSAREDCENPSGNPLPMKIGVLGYIAQSGTRKLYRCGRFVSGNSGVYVHTVAENCAAVGFNQEAELGYVSDPGHP
jgi:hypothetical protein